MQLLLCLVVRGGEFCRPCDHSLQEILPLLRTLTNEAERTVDSPEPPGHDNLVMEDGAHNSQATLPNLGLLVVYLAVNLSLFDSGNGIGHA